HSAGSPWHTPRATSQSSGSSSHRAAPAIRSPSPPGRTSRTWPALVRRHLRQRRRQRRLPVVHVPDGPHVHMRLGALKLCLGHGSSKKNKYVSQNRSTESSRNTVTQNRSDYVCARRLCVTSSCYVFS